MKPFILCTVFCIGVCVGALAEAVLADKPVDSKVTVEPLKVVPQRANVSGFRGRGGGSCG